MAVEAESNLVSSLHHVIVLDGLDTTKLHDDVNGVLAPVADSAGPGARGGL